MTLELPNMIYMNTNLDKLLKKYRNWNQGSKFPYRLKI